MDEVARECERGATQVLKMLPSDAAVMGEVVNLFQFKADKPRSK